jgi:hypothetical protein
MAILMHGNWDISVAQKEAGRAQRFLVSGALSGNGAHEGVVGASVVQVRGSSWSLIIQSLADGVWQSSVDKLQFTSANCSYFRIASDDGGGGGVSDMDFNDLVLQCTAVATNGATDYFVYGHVSTYDGICFMNPCWRDWLVIDSRFKLMEALKYPILHDYITKYYPYAALELAVKPPIPMPDPPPFSPMVLPLQGDTLLPNKQATLFKSVQYDLISQTGRGIDPELLGETFMPVKSFTLANTVAKFDVSKIAIGSLIDKFRFRCSTDNYGSGILRFIEYDRTGAEMAGGAYTGTGGRQVMGQAITDSFGNYLFRFSRSEFQNIDELTTDVAAGESFFAQVKPDIIVQIINPLNTSQVLYETPLNANISTCKRLNICIPKDSIGSSANPCVGQSLIQYIGNTLVAADSAGNRGGAGITLNSSGRVSGNGLNCAAWSGSLNVIGCQMNSAAIAYYTIRSRQVGTVLWKNVDHNEPCSLPRMFGGFIGTQSIRTTQDLHIDGGGLVKTDCYLNVESGLFGAGWITSINLKATLTTAKYTNMTGAGGVEFRLEGYDSSGNKLTGVDERILLYLDNKGIEAIIAPTVTLGGVPLGNCALFTLPKNAANNPIENAPLTVHLKAVQDNGFMGKYTLTIGKGAIGEIDLVKVGAWSPNPNTTDFSTGIQIGRAYKLTSVASCPAFTGTPDEGAVGDYIDMVVQPATTWLEANQTFCAFRLRIGGHIRHTDGTYHNPSYNSNEVLIGIQRV